MRFLSCSLAALAATLLMAGGARADSHGGVGTDGPRGADAGLLGADGAGVRQIERFLGKGAGAARAPRSARNVSLVGSLALGPQDGTNADVAGYKNLAFVGKWRGGCPGTGVDIIDISRPATPRKISDTQDYADTSMEDMDALRVGNRDILAIGLQDCGNTPAAGTDGLELYDISNPSSPVRLALLPTVEGVHELDLTTTPDGRTLALLAVPNLEAVTSDDLGLGGQGDAVIVDISDPAAPAVIGEYGVLDDFGLDFYFDVQRGGDARTYLHGIRASANGSKAYLAYWDAGFITLDISDPAAPVRLGRTSYADGEEGNAHSLDEARGGGLLVTADEDYTPFELRFTSSAFGGERPAVEATFTPPIVEQPGRQMSGQVVLVGRGCPAGSITGSNPADPYLADPAGTIAMIERGACRFDHKIARAQQAGATGVIVYNSAAGGEALSAMSGNVPVQLPGGGTLTVTIPAVFVQRSTGLLMATAGQPVTARAAAVFNGWGFLRIFDNKDPANPVQLGTFATPNATSEANATSGDYSVHNPEVRGNTVYASWYNDGVRVIDISQPSSPREVGSWTGAGAPPGAPPVSIWSVVPHGDLLLASDRTYGLYVLKRTP